MVRALFWALCGLALVSGIAAIFLSESKPHQEAAEIRDPAIESLLTDKFTTAVVALNKGKKLGSFPISSDKASTKLKTVSEKIAAVLQSATRVRGENGKPELIARLERDIGHFNQFVATKGYPYRISSHVLQVGQRDTKVILFSYRIEKELRFFSRKLQYPVALLRRLDKLQWNERSIGHATTNALEISLDETDRFFQSTLADLTAENRQATRTQGYLFDAECARKADVEGELVSVAKVPLANLFTAPEALRISKDRWIESLARHEVQHAIDEKNGLGLEGFGGIWDLRRDGQLHENTKFEFSAYLADLARAQPLRALHAGSLVGYLRNASAQSPEYQAAALIVRSLSIAMRGHRTGGRSPYSRQELIDSALRILCDPNRGLEKTAKGVWERVFSHPLPEIRDGHR